MKSVWCLVVCSVGGFFLLANFGSQLVAQDAYLPSPDRVREIATWLPVQPAGMGRPITDRAAWARVTAQHPELADLVTEAANTAAKPLPPWRGDLFLEFSRNGNRERWQKAESLRRERIHLFALAECVENRGRFLAPLTEAIQGVCAEPTWVLSAHDRGLVNLHQQAHDIDLGDAMVGLDLATTDWLLGDRLAPATRALIRTNLELRTFATYRAALNQTGREQWWIHGRNNWNSVCHNGVTLAALALIPSRAERAWYVAAAEQNVQSYLADGFTRDGYCVEGVGYWNYGFGNYAEMAEGIRQATGGHVDLLAQAVEPGQFGARAAILKGIYETIADCPPGTMAAPWLMQYLNRRFVLDRQSEPVFKLADTTAKLAGTLTDQATFVFLPQSLPVISAPSDLRQLSWRTCFPVGGVFILRPGPEAAAPFAVCIKGGNNGVSHGHNDAGSFSVVVGTNMVICDPGGEVYTARTFSAHRYDSGVLNSYGHALPVIDGQLERTGKDARAVLLATNFTPELDTVSFDLRPAYDMSGLETLTRTFEYSRGVAPGLCVHDEFVSDQARTFESALITWGKIRTVNDHTWDITDGSGTVRVEVDTGRQPFHVTTRTIHEDTENHRRPVHWGVVLDHAVRVATVTLRIRPVSGAQ